MSSSRERTTRRRPKESMLAQRSPTGSKPCERNIPQTDAARAIETSKSAACVWPQPSSDRTRQRRTPGRVIRYDLAALNPNSGRQVSAYYDATVDGFLAANPVQVIGGLAAANPFALDPEQRGAWQEEIQILRSALQGLPGTLYLEFEVPRLGSRIDAVLIAGSAVFPIEFKCGETQYYPADRNQVWDYALDLKNFHRASHDAAIFPVLVATEAQSSDGTWKPPHQDDVREPRKCNAADLGRVIREGLELAAAPELDGAAWGLAPYHPTPTIIEAARALTQGRQGPNPSPGLLQ
jgi:hypothetical protein